MCSVLDSGELQSLLATKVVLVCWIYTFYYDIFRGCFPAKLLKVLPKQHRLDGRTVKDWPPNTTNFLLANKSWPDVVVVSLNVYHIVPSPTDEPTTRTTGSFNPGSRIPDCGNSVIGNNKSHL